MTPFRVRLIAALFVSLTVAHTAFPQEPGPVGTLRTRWARDVTPASVLPEYPRPQMVRENWLNLNGEWEYAIRPKEEPQPQTFDGTILVPFAVESQLSGVQRLVGADNALWYRRTFAVPHSPRRGRLLLHFGAVDWHCQIWIDGRPLTERDGEHRGGYDPFSFELTAGVLAENNLPNPGDKHEIVIRVWDPSDLGSQPRGKQVRRPHGIWYTPVTGIWQTVWIEPVPITYIQGLDVVPDVDAQTLRVTVHRGGGAFGEPADGVASNVRVMVRDGNQVVAEGAGQSGEAVAIPIMSPRLWSPSDPFLYDLSVEMSDPQGQRQDEVRSYAGMRKVDFRKDADGFNRMFLNNEPLFQFGPLDQGWWPDGLYTAPTDEALRYDIEMTRRLGFNMCRKHVKVEPQRWYYWADRLGLLVWQDMPSGMGDGKNQFVQPDWKEDATFSADEAAQFRTELQALIDAHRNHPSIVAWVPFNEGWGQHQTNEILQWVQEYDPTRLVGGPSGWTDRGYGDLKDMHRYPGPAMFPVMDDRVSVLGEFGGLGLPLEGHTWLGKDNWGYRTFTSQRQLQENYEQLIRRLRPLIGDGLAAAIYTQTTDVEVEVNGLLTYDREVVKLDADRIAPLHARLYQPVGEIVRRDVLPTSEDQTRTWRSLTRPPADGWEQPDFDDAQWMSAPGGFGEPTTPGSVVNTLWKTPDIWLRQTFSLEAVPDLHELYLRIHHDEDAEIYLNGVRIAQVTGYTTGYEEFPLPPEAARALVAGQNVLAIHCHQTGGGQYIDAGLVDVEERPR